MVELRGWGHAQGTETRMGVPLAEGRDGVVIRILAREFMRRCRHQKIAKFQFAILVRPKWTWLLCARQA